MLIDEADEGQAGLLKGEGRWVGLGVHPPPPASGAEYLEARKKIFGLN